MRTYVLGDLHGQYQSLKQCLLTCNFDYSQDTLIQLGDIADRGDEVFDCVEELLKIKILIAIKGNHDDWFLDFIRTGFHPAAWNFGGIDTIKSYSTKAGKTPIIRKSRQGYKTSFNPDDIPLSHKQFFESQIPYYIDTKNNCYVHAGFNQFQPFHQQPSSIYYWDRILWQSAMNWQSKAKQDPNLAPFEIVTKFNNIFIGIPIL
ncbi:MULTISPECIES: metallophosphoesterase [Niastella]|uniref:Metallophosphoesterase n=1 Tax=Niastella soli TaxID=2821487 RepID=A0ABS3YZY7_9BACT|nr:metallophosphoesterase [Niastella soli]MBO9203394.1 metallophosphoesterase [Niastella soli]